MSHPYEPASVGDTCGRVGRPGMRSRVVGSPTPGRRTAQSEFSAVANDSRSRTLVGLGALLFLLGLLTGVVVPTLRSPRIGLSAHLEGVMNGTFLMVLGAIWHHVHLSQPLSRLCFWLLVYGTFANWLSVLLGAAFGAGRLMPIAGGGASPAGRAAAAGHRQRLVRQQSREATR